MNGRWQEQGKKISFGQLIWLGTFVANLIVVSMAAYIITENRRNTETEARLLTENYAKILEQNIVGFVNKIDIAHLNTIDEVNRQRSQGGIKEKELLAFLTRQDARLPEAFGVRVANSQGMIDYAVSNMQASNINIADRAHFIRHREDANAGLLISQPLLGRTQTQPMVVFARRINNPDGSFAGTSNIAVPVDHFIKQFSKLDLGQHGNIGLWSRSMLLARFSKGDPAGAKTGATTPSPQLRSLLDSEEQEASYQAKSGVDGVSRLYRFRHIAPYDLFLLVGLADEDYLAEWRSDAQRIGALVLLFFLVTLFFARLAHVNWQRREQAQAQLEVLNSTLTQRNEEAETARRQLELILASAGEGICGVDTQGKVTFINRSAREMFGWGEDEGIAEDLHALTHSRYADGRPFPAHECPAYATIQDGKPRRIKEDCYWRVDGSAFLVEYTVAALKDAGEITGAVNVFHNISERKRNELELATYRSNLETLVRERTAALLDTEERASHILNSSAGGLYGIDRNGLITFINPTACTMLGYRSEQLVGQSAHRMLHHSKPDGSPYPVTDCPSYRSLTVGDKIRVDNEVYWRADGQPLAVMYATHPMEKDGEITGAVTSFVDITEQRAAAEAREQALTAAENLARVRSEFLANMSHEIRTPLNGVLGFANIGHRNYQNSEKARDAFAKILASGQRLRGVINDILDFSKIEAGKLTIEQTEILPQEVIDQAVEIVAERIMTKNLALHLELAANLPSICIGDPLRLGQVLLNLLSNAVKFTETGHITLAARTENEKLIFTVSDSGIGMNEKQLSELFNAFQQADASATRRFGGTGLGLAISKRILELMNGDICAQSQLGIGSTFEFYIPLKLPSDSHLTAAASTTVEPPPSAAKSLTGISILAAEDEPINQMILGEILLEYGARTTIVNNGREALERILADGASTYDVVLMDLQMPEMDGYEASRRILELLPDLPIIAQTAHAFAEEREKCFAAGMVGHIAKPLHPEELANMIRMFVDDKRSD